MSVLPTISIIISLFTKTSKHINVKKFFLFCLSLFPLAATSQNIEISGVILDSLSLTAIPYATIGLFSVADSTPRGATISDTTGVFSLKTNRNGRHTLIITSLGKQTYRKPIYMRKGKS